MYDKLMRQLRENALSGLMLIAPFILSVVILKAAYSFVENSLLGDFSASLAALILPPSWLSAEAGRLPGLSVLVSLLLLLSIGIATHSRWGQSLLEAFDRVCVKVPVFRVLYAALRKAVNSLGDSKQERFKKVVFTRWPAPHVYTLAFVTSEMECDGQKIYSLFVPHMPNPTSGFVIIVAASEVIESSMSPGEALQFGMSLGVVAPKTLLGELCSKTSV